MGIGRIDIRKKMADSWFSYLQDQICKEFEFLELLPFLGLFIIGLDKLKKGLKWSF